MSTLSNIAQKRILKDIKELHDYPLETSGIYFRHNEEDISQATALMFGPSETPYHYGIYLFRFKFPNNYPFEPPIAQFMTCDPAGHIRFHPNLYVEGKVCLSILNTWSGPPWTSVQTFSSVLLSIKSILDKNPLENEPGFENTSSVNNNYYNNCIRYANYKVSILHIIKNLPVGFECYQETINKYFLDNYQSIRDLCHTYNDKYGGTYYCSTYAMTVETNYPDILEKLEKLYKNLNGDEITDTRTTCPSGPAGPTGNSNLKGKKKKIKIIMKKK